MSNSTTGTTAALPPKPTWVLPYRTENLREVYTLSLALAVVPLLHNPVEQLPSLAELHDEVDGGGVLVGAVDDVGVLGEVSWMRTTPLPCRSWPIHVALIFSPDFS